MLVLNAIIYKAKFGGPLFAGPLFYFILFMEGIKMSDKLTLSARERIASLLDDSSFVEIGSRVTARATDFNITPAGTPGDGVVTGYGVIGDKLVYVYSQDASVLGGSIGEMHAKKIAALYDMATKVGAPVVGLIDCAGLRLQEGTDALTAFGRIYKKSAVASGVIPQITAVFGNCGGGAAVLASLADFTFATKSAKLFVNSPNALSENYQEKLDTASADYVGSNTSLIDEVCESELDTITEIRNLISILPSNNEVEAVGPCTDELNRTIPGIESFAGDSRAILQNIADDNLFVELKKSYAEDVVTGFIKMGGATVGAVANQARLLSSKGAAKISRFVSFCDSFGIPVLSITNVKGFEATVEDEKHIAVAAGHLALAFADATVPKVSLVTGDAFGTAYTVMNSRSIGADIVFAWPQARIATMDSEMAAKIICESEIAEASDKVAAIKEAKKKLDEAGASAEAAARRGYVDDIIEPDATRKRLIAAFEMLATKVEERPVKKHYTF